MKDTTCARYGAKSCVNQRVELWGLPSLSSPRSAPLTALGRWVECVRRVDSGVSGVRKWGKKSEEAKPDWAPTPP